MREVIKGCEDLYNCCDCGGEGCGCAYCFSCNACDSCKDESDKCENIEEDKND